MFINLFKTTNKNNNFIVENSFCRLIIIEWDISPKRCNNEKTEKESVKWREGGVLIGASRKGDNDSDSPRTSHLLLSPTTTYIPLTITIIPSSIYYYIYIYITSSLLICMCSSSFSFFHLDFNIWLGWTCGYTNTHIYRYIDWYIDIRTY